MSYYLFLDDERLPQDVTWVQLPAPAEWVVVRNQREFEQVVTLRGLPEFVSFDNDLGLGCGEGRACAKWLVEQVLDGKLAWSNCFGYAVHSKNNVAANWINQYLRQACDFLAALE